MARRTALNTEARKGLLANAELGMSLKDCAILSGVSERSLLRWLQQGREESEEALAKDENARSKRGSRWRFWQDFNVAMRKGKRKLVRRVDDASKEDWRAGAFLLSRRYPEEYGARQTHKVQHSGPDGEALRVQHDLTGMSPEQLAALVTGVAAPTNGKANGGDHA